ncbi:CHAT domain-containing protein [Pantanalinema sp. GBBB05]|uniref:CHAT domain-containing protein n=1 Tax=Pantanalinema sp. GBBB05 TaxID=2604139 RepID=UPI003D818892
MAKRRSSLRQFQAALQRWLSSWFGCLRLPSKWLVHFGLSVGMVGLTIVGGWGRMPSAAQTTSDLISPHSQLAQSAPTNDPTQLVQTAKEYYRSGQYAAAVTLWQQAASLFEGRGDRLNQSVVLSNLALTYQQIGQWTEAEQAIAQSLSLLNRPQTQGRTDEANQQSLLAQALNIQGSLQLAQGRAQAALDTWQQATKLYQQQGDQTGAVRSLINQSQALRALGLYPRARNTLLQVNQTLQGQPDSPLKVASLLSFGDALRLMGDMKQSELVLRRSLAIAQTLSPSPDLGAILLSLGNTMRAEQRSEQALNYYQQAIGMADSPSTKVQAHLNQLRLLIDTEDWATATGLIPTIQAQLATLPSNRITVQAQINLAQLLMRLDTQGQGVNQPTVIAQLLATAAQQAKALADLRMEAYATGYLGSAYERNRQWAEAQQLTERALILAQSTHAGDIAYRWQWQLGRLLKAQGDHDGAIGAYSQAVQTLRDIRNDLVSNNLDVQFSFRESVEPVYRQFVGLLLEPSNGQPTSQENLKKAREVIESLQIAELDNFFREACLTGRAADIDRIDPTAAIVYPIILSDRLEVVLSLPNQPLHHYATAIPQTQLEAIFLDMRRSLRRTAGKQERMEIAQKVYDLLIRPLESDLTAREIKTLAFVLDGALKNLPMAALHDGQQFLVEKYAIALTPGLQLLDPRPLQRQQLKLLVGGLSEGRQGFVPLPGVEQEIDQIKSEVPAQVLFNQNFTSAQLQQQISSAPFPVVHLATHGQFSSNADETFVLVWDSRLDVKQLGELLQARAQETQTPIELLVLSACQTADGDRRAALGLAGVAVRSGARSTLATLWPVDDESTSSFMVQFYQELAKPNMTKSAALQQAQLKLLHESSFKHPYYWAPFVLVGNWL